MNEPFAIEPDQELDPASRPERRPISKRLRFEIFKRDQFKCVYCGRTPPAVVLHLDHLEPVSASGSDDPTNLFTACVDCNLGKSDRRIENSLPQVQPDEIEAMAERVEQMTAYQHWRTEFKRRLSVEVDAIYAAWIDEFDGELIEDESGRYYRSSVDFPTEKMLLEYLEELPTAQIVDAVGSASWRYHDRHRESMERSAVRRYFYAVCKNKIILRREERLQIRVTWTDLIAKVPELDALRDEVETFHPLDPWNVCADRIWTEGWVTIFADGVRQDAQSPRSQIEALVGPKSRNAGDAILESLAARDAAIRTIQSSLPLCGQTCVCGRPKRPPIPQDYPRCKACGQAYEPVDWRESCVETVTEWNGQEFGAILYGHEPWLHTITFAENYGRWHRLATPRAPAIPPRCSACRTPLNGFHHPGCGQQACPICGDRANGPCASRGHLAIPLAMTNKQIAAKLRRRQERQLANLNATESESAIPA